MDLKATSALRHAVLDHYFWNDREARLWQARATALSAAGNAEGAAKALRSMARVLMPEIGKEEDDFRQTAQKIMETWRDRVFAIERAADGAPTVSAYRSKTVEKELLEFAREHRPVRAADRGRQRRMVARERMIREQKARSTKTIPRVGPARRTR